MLLLAIGLTGAAAAPPDAEIRKILAERIDRDHQGVGMVVGVVEASGRRLVVWGKLNQGDARVLDGNTVFEIGSVTKVFTSLLLADMVRREEVALSDPVAQYLPAEVKMPERGGRAITLVDLATHTSGLPRMPSNFRPKNPANPYADYSVKDLYEFLSGYQLTRDIGSQFEYSNLGGGLLGLALARRAGMEYEALVRARITEPLGMSSTTITLTPDMKARLAVGHNAQLEAVANWDLPTLAGAGALRSTANDLMTFVAANLGYVKSPLAPAMASMLAARRPAGAGLGEIGLAWLVARRPEGEIVWHNGGTGGYRSFVGYSRQSGVGVVVLSNTSTASGVDDIGMHLLDSRIPLLPAPKEHKQTAIDPKLLDGYVGQYQLAPQFVIAITRDGDQLYAQATNQPKLPLFPEGPRDFFFKAADAQISFETDGNGRATSLTLHQNGANIPGKRLP